MRKLFSSAFILVLLFLTLWGISAWVISKQNEEIIRHYFDENSVYSNHLFNAELLELSSSIFNSKAKISVNANNQSFLTVISNNLLNQAIYDIEIKNGPILIDQSKFKFGKSLIKLIPNVNLTTNIKQNNQKKQLPTIHIRVDFKDNIFYQIPITTHFSKLILKGVYDTKTTKIFGVLSTNGLLYKSKNYQLTSEAVSIQYQSIIDRLDNPIAEQNIALKAENFSIDYKHRLMDKSIKLKLEYNGDTHIKNNVITSNNQFSYMNTKHTDYPTQKGLVTFNANNLDVDKLLNLFEKTSYLQHLNQQTQWVLEEQSELPEGQDQIWQLQDQIKQIIKQMPDLSKEVLMLNDKSVFKFTLQSQYNGEQSNVVGDIQSIQSVFENENISELSVSSIAQVNAKVTLDKFLFEFISQHLPINKKQFNLIFKHNKLLMQ